LGWRSKYHTEAGSTVLGGLESQFGRGPGSRDRSERVGLVCARGTDEACVFQGTQLGTLIRVSPFLRDGTSWLLSSTVVITGT
jgi:hypothetical protein